MTYIPPAEQKRQMALDHVDNTSDAEKAVAGPIYNAIQMAVAGGGGGGGGSLALEVDTTWPVAYAAYFDRITRLDYGTSPPTRTHYLTPTPLTDWPSRTSLTYS